MNHDTTTLITGGSGGIGLEMARLLAARGHRLLLVSRDASRLEAAASELRRSYGTEVLVHAMDLSAPGAAQSLFEHTQRQELRIDALVKNAGFGIVEEHVAIEPAQIQPMLQLDVVAVAELCHRYGGEMKRRRAGRILNVASTAAFQPTPYPASCHSREPAITRVGVGAPAQHRGGAGQTAAVER